MYQCSKHGWVSKFEDCPKCVTPIASAATTNTNYVVETPTPGKKLTRLTENIFAVEIPGDAINILVGRYFIYWDTNGSSNELALPPGSYTLLFLSKEATEYDLGKVVDNIWEPMFGRVYMNYETGMYVFSRSRQV